MTVGNDGQVSPEGKQERPEPKRLYPTIGFQEVQALHSLASIGELRRCSQAREVQGHQEISEVHPSQYRLDFCLP
jgi:hypothetical protein